MGVGTWNTSMNPADLAKKSFSAMITQIAPNGSAPLFGISSMLETETAFQPEHGFFSKTMIFPKVTLNGAIANGGVTNFTVVSSANILPGMILEVASTREHVLVTAVPDGVTITVARGIGTVAAGAINTAVDLYMVGNAYEEASVRPQSLVIVPSRVINLTQIFRNTWLTSGTSAATAVIAGQSIDAENKRDCAMFHAVDIEKALLFGQYYTGTRNNMPFRCMDGLINNVTANAAGNVTTLGGTTSWTQLEAACDPAFQFNTNPKIANERLFVCGGTAKRVLHQIFRLNSTYMIQGGTTSWGLRFDQFQIPRGTLNMIEHSLFNAFGSAAPWAKMAVAIDLTTFGTAYMTGRRTKNNEFNQAGLPVDNGIDAVGGTLTSELTCLVKNPAANAILYNFTAGVQG